MRVQFLCITIQFWKSPTNIAVHVHVCDVGVGGGGFTSLIAMYVNLNGVAQVVRIT